MSSRDSRLWRLWWRFGGDAVRRQLAAGDVAAAASAYTSTVAAWLRAEVDWKRWEIAAAYSPAEIAAGRRLGDALGHRHDELALDFDRIEVPDQDPAALIDDMDAAFSEVIAAHAVLVELDPDAPTPERDEVHRDALRRYR